MTLASFFLHFDGDYAGACKDWQREAKCYAFWEIPELLVRLKPRDTKSE
jgi:hypothetical protein